MTRCKINDLAVIFRVDSAEQSAAIGSIIVCKSPILAPDGRHGWIMDRKILGHEAVLDECLRPLRSDPGTDQMLLIAGLPESLNLPQGEEA